MIHRPRFLCICNNFCFADIVVETNSTLSIVEEMLVFLFERVRPPSVQFPVQLLQQVMISCSIHGIDELHSCKEFFLRNSSFLVE